MKKVLVLNISTDSKNTSLGFGISWLNAFAKKFDEVHVISLSRGSYDELEKNVLVSSVDNFQRALEAVPDDKSQLSEPIKNLVVGLENVF